jgi:hypothetical protein
MLLRLLLIFVVLHSWPGLLMGQIVKNQGFESWVQDTFSTTFFGIQIESQFERPNYWITPDKYAESSLLNTSLVAKDTGSYAGNYAAKLSTKAIAIPGQGMYARPGALTNGQLTLNLGDFLYTFSGGSAISKRPAALKGYFKFFPKGFTRVYISVEAKSWDPSAQESITVGRGRWVHGAEQSTYQQFTVPVTYTSCQMPDTVLITILGGSPDTSAIGTTFYIDSLQLDTMSAQANLPPFANDDDTATRKNESITYNVLKNDQDCESSLSKPTLLETSNFGSFVVNADSTVTFSPDSSYTGYVSNSYLISDGQATDTATFEVYVNVPPQAVNDTVSIGQDSSIETDVLANDSDPEFNPVQLDSIIRPPANGTAQITGYNTIQYTPNSTFSGRDSLAYVICDHVSPPLCDTAHLYTKVLVGIEEAKSNAEIGVYPNPISSEMFLTIQPGLLDDHAPLTIVNTKGEMVKRFQVKDNRRAFDVHDLTNGLYFYVLKQANGEKLTEGKVMIAD